MATVGQQLSAAREQRGYSITDVEKGTSIRALYIQAIEAGDYEVVPGEVYLKGFIRNYATFVGLDGSVMVELYKQEQQITVSQEPVEAKTQAEPVQEKNGSVSPLRENASFPVPVRAEKSFGWAAGLAVAAVLVAGYWWWSGTSAPAAVALAEAIPRRRARRAVLATGQPFRHRGTRPRAPAWQRSGCGAGRRQLDRRDRTRRSTPP